MKKNPELCFLPGGDDQANLYLSMGRLFREYTSTSFPQAQDIIEALCGSDLEEIGIIQTWVSSEPFKKPFVLEHRLLTLSLPESWSLPQMRDALLHTIKVSKNLSIFDLTLKDYLPENIAFDGPNPFFVDFASIVKSNSLPSIDWLARERGTKSPTRYLISQMLIPYFLVPIVIGYVKSERDMREILKNNYCNSGNPIPKFRLRFRDFSGNKRAIVKLIRVSLALRTFGRTNDLTNELSKIREFVLWLDETFRERPSAYSSYYSDKNEDFSLVNKSDWQPKQLSVEKIIMEASPTSTLDIGSNTGWFSLLAAIHGSRVTAVDVDASSIGRLYEKSKKEKHRISSLVITFDELVRNIEENAYKDFPRTRSRILPRAALHSELVLVLGLIHHLCLGSGYSLEKIMQTLSAITGRYLVIEFVSLSDEKILNDPGFFPELNKQQKDYSLDELLNVGSRFFGRHKIYESNPATRAIVVFWND